MLAYSTWPLDKGQWVGGGYRGDHALPLLYFAIEQMHFLRFTLDLEMVRLESVCYVPLPVQFKSPPFAGRI